MINPIQGIKRRLFRPFKKRFDALSKRLDGQSKSISKIGKDLSSTKQQVGTIEKELARVREVDVVELKKEVELSRKELIDTFDLPGTLATIDTRLEVIESSLRSIEKLLVLNDAANSEVLQRLGDSSNDEA